MNRRGIIRGVLLSFRVVVCLLATMALACSSGKGGDVVQEEESGSPRATEPVITNEPTHEPSPQPTASPTPTVATIGDAQLTGTGSASGGLFSSEVPVEVTVNGARVSYGESTLAPKPGNLWVYFDISVKNVGGAPAQVSNLNLSARDESGRTYGYSIDGLIGSNGLVHAATAQPGETVRGEVPFEIPQQSARVFFIWENWLSESQVRWAIDVPR